MHELQSSQALFHAVFENAPLGYAILDKAAVMRHVNSQFKKLFSLVANFEGFPVTQLFLASDVPHFEKEAAMLDDAPEGSIRSVVLQCAPGFDQRVQWLSLTLSRVPRACSCAEHYLVIAEEVSEQVQREKDLLQANKLLEREIEERREAQKLLEQSRKQAQDLLDYHLTILEDFPALTWRADKTGTRDYFNRTWLEFSGSSLSNELGDGWLDNVHPDDLPTSLERIRQSVSARQPFEISYRLLRADGEWRWITDLGRPFRGPKGEYAGYIGCCIDITLRIDQQMALQEAKARAEAADMAKSEFLANISHEVRTPLNGIIGMLDALMDSAPTAPQAEYIETAKYSAKQLLDVLNDLLDLARIEAGNLRVQLSHINVADMIRKAVDVYALEAQGLGLELRAEVGPELEPVTIPLDEVRMRQMIFNLVGNAFKFTNVGGQVSLNAFLSGPPGTQKLVLMVSDTGIGIADEKLSSIFEPFVQAEGSLTRQFGGAGLGLSIVRKLVSLMQGTICVMSELGVGSLFAISIPVSDVSQANAPVKELTPEEEDLSLPSLHVLLVEDDSINRLTAKLILEKLGIQVSIAHDGRQALESLDKNSFDIVYMDIQMPVMDGLAATRAIREKERRSPGGTRQPIIAMTAHAMKGDREMCLKAGMDEYVSKPLDKKALLKATRAALGLGPS
ncbi:MAG: response regulator [Acidobacteriota bacterium]